MILGDQQCYFLAQPATRTRLADLVSIYGIMIRCDPRASMDRACRP